MPLMSAFTPFDLSTIDTICRSTTLSVTSLSPSMDVHRPGSSPSGPSDAESCPPVGQPRNSGQEWGTHFRTGPPVLGVKPHQRPGNFRPNPTAHLTGVGRTSTMPISTLARRIPLQSLAITPLLAAALLVGTGSAPTSSVTHEASPASSTATATAGPVAIKAQPVAFTSVAALRAYRGRLAVKIAYYQRGKPYRYGAAGPWAYDCS